MSNSTATASPLPGIIDMFQLQDRLFRQACEGLSAHSTERPNEMTNHAAWLAGHLVSSRHTIAAIMGKPVPEPYPGLFEHGKAIDPAADYPSVEQCIEHWDAITPQLHEALGNITAESMAAKAPFALPPGDTNADLLMFFAHHEAYHIGQLGILRKFFGMESMKYG